MKNISLSIRTLALLTVLVLAPTAASAMTVIAADLHNLIGDSHTIVDAKVSHVQNVVEDAEGRLVGDGELLKFDKQRPPNGLRAFTDVTLRITTHYKGDGVQGGELKLRLVGGALGRFRVTVPGMPTFLPGTRVLLFLESTPQGLTPLGAAQGVFRVLEESDGSLTAIHDLQGMAVIRRDIVPADCSAQQLNEGPCMQRSGPGLPAIPHRMPHSSLDHQIRAFLGLPAAAPLLKRAPQLRTR